MTVLRTFLISIGGIAFWIGIHEVWEDAKLFLNELYPNLTYIILGILILVGVFATIYDYKSRRSKKQYLPEEQEITHSKETLCRIFEYLCSTEPNGNEELVLSIPVPLDEYYKDQDITDITIHDYLSMNIDKILNSTNNESTKYAFVSIKDNPVNVNWGLSHLEHKEYSTILSHYTNAQEKCKIFNSLSKESKDYVDKIIEDKITKPFFDGTKIPDYIRDQIKYIITNAIMMNYVIHHRDVFNVCRTTQEKTDSKQLHEAMNNVLQDNTIITQMKNITKTISEMKESLEQFKKEMKQMVTKTRDDYIVKGKCDICSP